MDLQEFFDKLGEKKNERSAAFIDVEMVATSNGFKFDGIAAPTGVVAEFPDFSEEYERGSFRRFLAACSDNIPFLHEHNPRDLMATTRSGRLSLNEDGKGLRARADVAKTDLSERVKTLVDSGDIGGMSIGMVVGRGNAKVALRSGKPHRAITNFRKILDVCTTFDPAYVTTEAQFRSMTMEYAGEPELLQQLLRGAYPQLQVQGNGLEDTNEPEAAADELIVPDGDLVVVGEGDVSGAAEHRSIAARKRALSFLLLTTGDPSHET